MLTAVDGGQLERYAVYFARWRQCEAEIAQLTLAYVDAAPQFRESLRLDKALKQIEMCYGLTPAARARLKVEGERSPDDPMEEMLRVVR